jgi:hypothetical protein
MVSMALLLAACAGPAPSAAPPPTPTSLKIMPGTSTPSPAPQVTQKEFHSGRYGYTVSYSEQDWLVSETAGEWEPGSVLHTSSPGTDTFFAAGNSSDVIVIAAQPAAAGVTTQQWADSQEKVIEDFDGACVPGEVEGALEAGGETAVVNSLNCSGAQHFIFVYFIHDGRSFEVHTRSTSGDASDDWPNLQKLLSTLTFTD